MKLSEQELDSALNGEILIRNISSYKNICLDVENAEINSCLDELKELNPRYFVEVLQIRKANDGDDVIKNFLSFFQMLSLIQKFLIILNGTRRQLRFIHTAKFFLIRRLMEFTVLLLIWKCRLLKFTLRKFR